MSCRIIVPLGAHPRLETRLVLTVFRLADCNNAVSCGITDAFFVW